MLMISHVLNFLLKIHLNQILVQENLKPTLLSLQANLREKVEAERKMAAYNLAALRYFQRQYTKERSQSTFLDANSVTLKGHLADGLAGKKRKISVLNM